MNAANHLNNNFINIDNAKNMDRKHLANMME